MDSNKKLFYYFYAYLLGMVSIIFSASQEQQDLQKWLIEEQGMSPQAAPEKAQQLLAVQGDRQELARQILKDEQIRRITVDEQLAGQSYHDLIMLLDPQVTEKMNDLTNYAITNSFFIALYQKAAPIIVTKNLCENLCFLMNIVGPENIAKMRETMMYAIEPYHVKNKATKIFNKLLAEEKYKHFTLGNLVNILPVMSSVDFDNNNWHGYMHKTENLVLLIPQQYIDANKQGNIRNCGFELDNLMRIPDLSPDKFGYFLEQQKTNFEDTDSFMNALESMLTQDKLTLTQNKLKRIIYLLGHGKPAEIIKTKLLKKKKVV